MPSESNAWHFFVKEKDDSTTAICSLCKEEISCFKQTTSMMKHLQRKHNSELEEYQMLNNAVMVNDMTDTVNYAALNRTFRDKQLKFFVTGCVPFQVVENEYYRDLLKTLNPHVNAITADTITNDLLKSKTEADEKTKQMLKGKKDIVVLTDGWTSKSSKIQLYSLIIAYCGPDGAINQHFCAAIPTNDTDADSLTQKIGNELLRFGISFNAVKFLVSDGASNLKCFSDKVRLEQVHCAAHQINLVIVQEMILFDKLVTKIRKLARFLAKSPKQRALFLKTAKESKLPLTVPKNFSDTRWAGIVDMLQATDIHIKTIATIATTVQCFGKFSFSSKETPMLKLILMVIVPLKYLIRTLESRTATASVIIPSWINTIMKIKNDFDQLDDKAKSQIKRFKEKVIKHMQSRLEYYYSNDVVRMAIFLDPRFCLIRKIEHSLFKWNVVEAEFKLILENDSEMKAKFDDASKVTPKKKCRYSNYDALLAEEKEGESDNWLDAVEKELAKYRNIILTSRPSADNKFFDFWRINESTLPNMTKMARKFGAVPASSAETERIFSSVTRMTSDKTRNRLKGETVAAYISCLASLSFQKNVNSDYGLDDSSDSDEEEENEEENEEGNEDEREREEDENNEEEIILNISRSTGEDEKQATNEVIEETQPLGEGDVEKIKDTTVDANPSSSNVSTTESTTSE